MQYLGEHLIPGQLGHLCAVLSFVAALLAAFSFFFATQNRADKSYEGWRSLGRFAFLLHGLATFGIIASLFFILTHKMYEYQYAWANVSDDLPMRYVFSAFWKEQQGSFLLWSFWHIGLGIVLMLRAGKWETPVLAVVALAEVFIASMLLGVYFNEFRLGASPFDLLRNVMEAPIFNNADYLAKIKGNGLNPLLQNYWMTIHPPTLFLGFASTIVPFAYAIAGLWTREHRAWLKPALSWSLFSATILGTGILMGGAWAYEALSFAGYWAWDPVENTSLVPWLVLLGGIHTNLVARNTGYSIRSAYAFYLLTFILILYSTYLTRSGILGDTSVHSFTEMGLGFQLLLFISGFSILSLVLFFSRYKGVPDVTKKIAVVVPQADSAVPKEVLEEVKTEESAASREFWMFIGALVLLFSALLMTGATSLPVWNKIVQLFDKDYVGAVLKNPIEHHNRYQLWIAVFIGMLTGLAQWMRYAEKNLYTNDAPPLTLLEKKLLKYAGVLGALSGIVFWYFINVDRADFSNLKTWVNLFQTSREMQVDLFGRVLVGGSVILLLHLIYFIKRKQYWKPTTRKLVLHLTLALGLAAGLTALNTLWIDVEAWQLFVFLFAAMFGVVANLDYLISVVKGNMKLAAATLSHVGFGILLLGILSTGLGKDWISVNAFAMDGLIEGADDKGRTIILMKDAPMPMRGFTATYQKDTIERQTRTFSVHFERRDQEGNPTGENFTLFPNVMYDRKFSKVVANNPSTQHYWNYDIFTLVPALPKGELDPEFAKQQDDSLKFEKYEARVGDTIFTKKHYLVVEAVTKTPKHPEYEPEKGDLAVGLQLSAHALDDPKTYPAAPMLYIRPNKGGFSLPADIGPLQMKIRLTEASMEQIFKAEADLKYTNFGIQEGGSFEFKGYKIRFANAIKNVQHPSYAPEPGDIAVAAGLEITAPDGRKAKAAPVYLIRGNQPFSLKDEAPSMGLHFRFENIDPGKGILTIGVAQATEQQSGIPIEIAENAARSDYIVLEAIIFPGINLVWLGSILMLFGLGFGLWRKLSARQV